MPQECVKAINVYQIVSVRLILTIILVHVQIILNVPLDSALMALANHPVPNPI